MRTLGDIVLERCNGPRDAEDVLRELGLWDTEVKYGIAYGGSLEIDDRHGWWTDTHGTRVGVLLVKEDL